MIPEFYEDCEIFMTGGSGVVGKALIEKLLRSCNPKCIYLLLREKRNYSLDSRLEKIRSAKIFRVLRAKKPNALDKLVAIPGDAILPNLGISEKSAKIMENVTIVFHCAATVRFDEPIKMAMTLNVGGTLETLKFAETLKQLKVFMHISTFYSNPYLQHVENKLYSSPIDWRLLLKLAQDGNNDDTLNFLTKKMITGFPNTYCFTKNLAETVVNEYRTRLPVMIYRPSIVLFAFQEPEPGFAPTLMGAMGLFALVGAGILKTVYLNYSVRLDITPQDVGTNSLVFYTTLVSDEYKNGPPAAVPIYMSSSYGRSSHTFREMGQGLQEWKIWERAPMEKSLLPPHCSYTNCRYYYIFLVFTKQILPALIVDLLLRLFGRKPAIMSIVRKAFITLEVMQPFLFNNYTSSGISEVERMSKAIKGTDFDILDIINNSDSDKALQFNCTNMILSIREVLLNEDPSTLERSLKVFKVKRFIVKMIELVFYFYVLRWFFRCFYNYVMKNYA